MGYLRTAAIRPTVERSDPYWHRKYQHQKTLVTGEIKPSPSSAPAELLAPRPRGLQEIPHLQFINMRTAVIFLMLQCCVNSHQRPESAFLKCKQVFPLEQILRGRKARWLPGHTGSPLLRVRSCAGGGRWGRELCTAGQPQTLTRRTRTSQL